MANNLRIMGILIFKIQLYVKGFYFAYQFFFIKAEKSAHHAALRNVLNFPTSLKTGEEKREVRKIH